MPYRTIEQVFSRKHERVAAMFSVHNVIGIVALALPVYIGLSNLPNLPHIVLTTLAAALGYVMTLDRDGMAIYERIIWQIRAYAAPLLTGKRVLSPSQLPGMQVQATPRVMVHGGPVRVTKGRRSRTQGALAPKPGGTQTVRKVSRPARPAPPRPLPPAAPAGSTELDAELMTLPDDELVALPDDELLDTDPALVGTAPALVGAEER